MDCQKRRIFFCFCQILWHHLIIAEFTAHTQKTNGGILRIDCFGFFFFFFGIFTSASSLLLSIERWLNTKYSNAKRKKSIQTVFIFKTKQYQRKFILLSATWNIKLALERFVDWFRCAVSKFNWVMLRLLQTSKWITHFYLLVFSNQLRFRIIMSILIFIVSINGRAHKETNTNQSKTRCTFAPQNEMKLLLYHFQPQLWYVLANNFH